jgi:two-component system sensor histidine kinase KdpD
VLENLIENARKHGSPPFRLATECRDGNVRIRVVDHGPGVPDAAKGSMFEPFQRLGDAPAGEGVGLGLAVARGLTEAMGGTLTASDTPGGGLTMTVSLPAVPTPRPLHELVQP